MNLTTVLIKAAPSQSVMPNSVTRRWAVRLLFCLSLVLAQLQIVSHVHAVDSEHGLANHDCATCIVAEIFQSTSLNTAKSVLPTAQNVFIARQIVTHAIDLAHSPYQGRAPPHAIPV